MKKYLILAILVFSVVLLIIIGPVPQEQEYHHFIDNREFFGIQNFQDVVSNFPFLIVGLLGLYTSLKIRTDKWIKLFSIVLFSGFVLLTFGSGVYHLQPCDFTLMLDRIPISLLMLAFFTIIIFDFHDAKTAKILFIPLEVTGISGVLYWYYFDDLRLYILVQFFPVIAIPMIIWIYRSVFSYMREIIFIFLFFFLAKVAEGLDEEIFLLNGQVSGHTLKHLFMAVSGGIIIQLIGKREKQAEIKKIHL